MRLTWHGLMALVMTGMLAAIAAGQTLDLRARFEVGDEARWRYKADLEQRSVLESMDYEQEDNFVFELELTTTVREVGEESITIGLVFDRARARWKSTGNQVRDDAYDSATPEKEGTGHLKKAIDAAIGVPVTLRLRPTGEVYFSDGLMGREPFEKDAATLFARMFDQRQIERGMGAMFRLKDRHALDADETGPITQATVGEVWQTERREASRTGTLYTHFEHTLASVEAGVANVQTSGKLVMKDADITPISATFEQNEVAGAARWDVATGGLIDWSLDWKTEMVMGGDSMPIRVWIVEQQELARVEAE